MRDELVEMGRVDQEERSHFGEPDAEPWNDEERTARLREIIDEYGWPTPDRFGDAATSAAWLIAQHSDADPGFQQRVLSLLTEQVPDYPGKGEHVALLTDRVATNTGQPQVYGSQIGCFGDQPVPHPDLAEPDRVDELRQQAGLEPLDTYLARADQHCRDQALIPGGAGCASVPGATLLLVADPVILVGELHGTNESPAFVEALTCTALSFELEVTVGLEIPDDETSSIEAFLASDGGPVARDDLLSGPFWTSGFADGRQSMAMVDLLDSFRRHVSHGAALHVVLLDSNDATDRDAHMADRVIDAVEASPDAVAITLTGNVHNRRIRGASFDPDYEPMGYLVTQALSDQSVLALDVRYSGGTAWNCTPNDGCGPHTLTANTTDDTALDGAIASVDVLPEPNANGFDATHYVGKLSVAAPTTDTNAT